jgi:hypothetical protein
MLGINYKSYLSEDQTGRIYFVESLKYKNLTELYEVLLTSPYPELLPDVVG